MLQLFTDKKNTQSLIVFHIAKGVTTTLELFSVVQKSKNITKQAFYKHLRDLQSQGILIKKGQKINLNALWLRQVMDFGQVGLRAIGESNELVDLGSLTEGESLTYQFGTLRSLEDFWDHILVYFFYAHRGSDFFTYEPHNWLILSGREKSERYLEKVTQQSKITYNSLVGYKTLLGKKVKTFTEKGSRSLSVHILDAPLFPKNNYTVNVLDDFVIEVYINQSIADQIHSIFSQEKDITPEVRQKIEQLALKPAKGRIKVSRNPKKADMLRKKMEKYFHLKSRRKMM